MHISIITAISMCASVLHAEEWSAGSFSSEANPISRISQALFESKIDELTPKSYAHNERSYSYHLSSVRYLGGVSRGDQHFTVASVLFIRSSPKGSETPPARGHGFLLMLDRDYHIASYCRIDFPDQIELLGAKLYRYGKLPFEGERSLIGDFDSADIPSRSRGFLIDGDAFLPYPFTDRIDQSRKRKMPGIKFRRRPKACRCWIKAACITVTTRSHRTRARARASPMT